MTRKKSPDGLGGLTPDDLISANWPTPDVLKAMTWMELARWESVLNHLRETFRYEMDERVEHIAHIESLGRDDLEAYVRDRKPEWQYAKSKLDGELNGK